MTVLDDSVSDSPTEATVVTDVRLYSEETACNVFFRFQDADNFYVTSYCPAQDELRLRKVEDATGTLPRPLNATTASTALEPGEFHRLRVDCFVDGNGDLRASWAYDHPEDGWSSLGEDLVDSSPILPGGGGVGIGGYDYGDQSHGYVIFDETTIKYPQ